VRIDHADDPDGPEHAREAPGGADQQASPDARTVPGHHDAPQTPRRPDAPENRETPADTEAPDLRQQQLAEHARYRQTVDATYQEAARDAWAKAVPDLQAAWEDHKQRYPERSRAAPRTHPDGSWSADANRRLTPEQNAEASKTCADLRDEADQVILPAIRRVESADPDRHLSGLPHMLKGENRLKEKIADALRARPELTAKQALSIVPDPVRFTLTYEPEHYAEGVVADVEQLKAEGFELIKLKNVWAADRYKGINSQWRRPETGTRFEMQFHTPESLEAKELTHEAYERIRSRTASPSERQELEEFQRRANALIVTPPGASEIKDFQGELVMADKIIYYAIVDEFSTRDRPGGVLRRVQKDGGQVDEVFSRDLTWEFSPILYAGERGDTMFDFVQITEEEAGQIVDRIRAEAAAAE
jgi:hypothetical protein